VIKFVYGRNKLLEFLGTPALLLLCFLHLLYKPCPEKADYSAHGRSKYTDQSLHGGPAKKCRQRYI
jgi:hypothetical protein